MQIPYTMGLPSCNYLVNWSMTNEKDRCKANYWHKPIVIGNDLSHLQLSSPKLLLHQTCLWSCQYIDYILFYSLEPYIPTEYGSYQKQNVNEKRKNKYTKSKFYLKEYPSNSFNGRISQQLTIPRIKWQKKAKPQLWKWKGTFFKGQSVREKYGSSRKSLANPNTYIFNIEYPIMGTHTLIHLSIKKGSNQLSFFEREAQLQRATAVRVQKHPIIQNQQQIGCLSPIQNTLRTY